MPSLVLFAIVMIAFFLLIIRPQRNRARALSALQAKLAPGVAVMTTSGLHGTVVAVQDDGVLLEVSPGVTVRFAKAAIGQVVNSSTDEASAAHNNDDEPDDVADADSVSDSTPHGEDTSPTTTDRGTTH